MAAIVNVSSDHADTSTGACQSRVALAQEGHHGQQELLEDQGRGQGHGWAGWQQHSETKPSFRPTGGRPSFTATD